MRFSILDIPRLLLLASALACGDDEPGPADAGAPDAQSPDAGEPETLRSEEHTSELQSHAPISYAVFCLKKKK